VLSFLVALEAIYTQRALKNKSFPDSEWVVSRGSEIIFILLVVKFAYYFGNGFDRLAIDLKLWRQDFSLFFLWGDYIFASFIIFLVWLFSTLFSAELVHLEIDEKELRLEQESGIFEARYLVRHRLVNMILFIGVGMVIMSTLLRLDVLKKWFDIPTLRAGVYNLLLYFLLGLVLLSMTQFNLLRANWLLERLPVRSEIAGRWFVYSFIFILLVTVVAGVLPTSYSVGLLGILHYIAVVLVSVLSLLLAILFTPVIMLINFLMSLISPEGSASPRIPPPDLTPALTPEEASAIPWLDLVKSLFFWVVFVSVIGFSVYFYFRERRELWNALRGLPVISAMVRFWSWLRSWAGGMNRQIGSVVGEGIQRLRQRLSRQRVQQDWSFINLRRLSPRERVIFYYLAMVRRGGEVGHKRKTSQTPYEYSQALSVRLTEAAGQAAAIAEAPLDGAQEENLEEEEIQAVGVDQDIVALTERFVEARYSQHDVNNQQASLVKRYWERVRQALRRPRRVREE
jgi:hypothetical protein